MPTRQNPYKYADKTENLQTKYRQGKNPTYNELTQVTTLQDRKPTNK